MNEKPTITYIEDGKQFTIKNFLKYRFQNEIAQTKNELNQERKHRQCQKFRGEECD